MARRVGRKRAQLGMIEVQWVTAQARVESLADEMGFRVFEDG